MTSPSRSPAVILDRDGTLTREQGFVTDPGDLELLPGVPDALARLAAAGYLLVVATNQSGIARGLYDESTLARIHERLHQLLDNRPRAYLHCPHLPGPEGQTEGYARKCECRKPGSGLVDRADRLFSIDWPRSFLVGDSARDLLMGQHQPSRKILVRSGKPWNAQVELLAQTGCEPELVADDLTAAADWILAQ